MNNRHCTNSFFRLVGGPGFVAFALFSNLMIEDARGSESPSGRSSGEEISAETATGKERVAAENAGLSEEEWNEVVKLLNKPREAAATQDHDSVTSLKAGDDKELLMNLLPALPTRALMASLSILPHVADEGRGGVSVRAGRQLPSMSRMRVEALER